MGLVYKNSIIPKDFRQDIAPRYGFYYDNVLWYSKAYQDLPKAARNLLHCLLNELRYTKNKKKDRRKEYTNNEHLSFTEIQFKKLHGYSSETYIKARNRLIRNGLIVQKYRGGYGKGDRSKYKLLFINGVPINEQRWHKFPEKSYENEIPQAKNITVGINTRFKKGKSGRKSKSTLPKYTLNKPNDPIKVDPKK